MFKIKKVRPLFTAVITTATTYKNDEVTSSGLITGRHRQGTLNLNQRVIAVGNTVSGIKEGDIVHLNFKRYLVPQHARGALEDTGTGKVQHDELVASYEVPILNIDGTDFLYLQNNDVEYVIEDYEVDDGGLLE